MLLPVLAVLAGFLLLVWSADRFVEGASFTAKYLGMSTLLIGMLIVGFGTSVPEMVVSAIAAMEGNPALALGNAYGSNIANIALILGITAIVTPITVHSKIIKKELPVLFLLIVLSGYLLADGSLNFVDGAILIAIFFVLFGWSVYAGLKSRRDELKYEMDEKFEEQSMPIKDAFFWLVAGLTLLIGSSKILVWGAVHIAHELGVSDLVIGLTIVALGTSLPELAASVSAARKGEHDLAVGNIVGSCMFNILAVVGIAALIAPMNNVVSEVFYRDLPVMFATTLALFLMAYGFDGKNPTITRGKGMILLLSYIAYNVYLGVFVSGV